MKFFYAPGACSIGIHVLLEETGTSYQAIPVDLRSGEQRSPDFAAVNPKQKVPVIQRDDGSVLTEFPAIAWWLAATHPPAKLIPADPEGQARVLELTDYIVGTMHMQGFTRIFRPSAFTPNAADEEHVRTRGNEIFAKGFSLMDKALDGREYLLMNFSIADAAFFYVSFWATRIKIPLPSRCAAHYQRLLARPAVQRVMTDEGFAA